MGTEANTALEANPYIIDLSLLGKAFFFILAAAVLIALLLKIVLDLRKYHYKD